jgi:MOSC domain-containing protein YiiM
MAGHPHRSLSDLEAKLDWIREAPSGEGVLQLIVRRPAEGEREVLTVAHFDVAAGLVGDDWSRRPSSSTADGGPHPEAQVTLMNARVAAAITGPRERWPLAGDQLYVDFDLSTENLPCGAQLQVGDVLFEISTLPHTGCDKFVDRFGRDALRFVSREPGPGLRLRGVNARVVFGGEVRPGDRVRSVARS